MVFYPKIAAARPWVSILEVYIDAEYMTLLYSFFFSFPSPSLPPPALLYCQSNVFVFVYWCLAWGS